MLQFRPEDISILREAMHHAPKAHIRRKATALWNLSQGRSPREVSAFLDISRVSLRAWVKRFQVEGVAGFAVREGRGRSAQADGSEIEALLRQSPRSLGLPQTRWTLQALSEAASSLRGFSLPSVRKALRRQGFTYKRGQPQVTSPDPEYDAKRGGWSLRFEKPEQARRT